MANSTYGPPPSYHPETDDRSRKDWFDNGLHELDGRIDFDVTRMSRLISGISQHELQDSEKAVHQQFNKESSVQSDDNENSCPRLNIVLQVVGSRGDVQPFVALALELQGSGHRVRLATHPVFKQFVEDLGLEFFDISGDPTELIAYMVRNPGIIPKMSSMRGNAIEMQKKAISRILSGCWKSCIRPCDCADEVKNKSCQKPSCLGKPPFIADLIIANPPSFAHIHCAEKLGIPLHIVFTMPWTPTRCFQHPLVNIRRARDEADLTNYLSYAFLDWITWQGLGAEINQFRSRCLGLERLDTVSAVTMMQRAEISHMYCWSESLIPRPADWKPNVSVVGFFKLPQGFNYKPPPSLATFLEAGPRPIYIGFGSIVINDPDAFTNTILEAVRLTGTRAVISKGWGGIGASSLHLPSNIYMLDDCPHTWLFPQVDCVVHHGGAGTTSAGLSFGRPTVVVPFFGDQMIWGEAVYRAGAGPRPIPWKSLTAELLAEAILTALNPQMAATATDLAYLLGTENGTKNGVRSLYRALPTHEMTCSILKDRKAVWKLSQSSHRLSAGVAELLLLEGLLESKDLHPLRVHEYQLRSGPWDPLSGGSKAVVALFHDTFKGLAEIGSDFTRKPYFGKTLSTESAGREMSRSIKMDSKVLAPQETQNRQIFGVRSAIGLGRVFQATVRAPMKFTVAMAEGAHNAPRLWGDRLVRKPTKVTGIVSGLSAGCQELLLGTFDGITGLVRLPVKGAVEDGAIGFAKGIGKGLIGMPVKFWAGMSGIVGYPLQGVDEQIKKAFTRDDLQDVRSSLASLGRIEYADLSDEERAYIRLSWEGNGYSLPKH